MNKLLAMSLLLSGIATINAKTIKRTLLLQGTPSERTYKIQLEASGSTGYTYTYSRPLNRIIQLKEEYELKAGQLGETMRGAASGQYTLTISAETPGKATITVKEIAPSKKTTTTTYKFTVLDSKN